MSWDSKILKWYKFSRFMDTSNDSIYIFQNWILRSNHTKYQFNMITVIPNRWKWCEATRTRIIIFQEEDIIVQLTKIFSYWIIATFKKISLFKVHTTNMSSQSQIFWKTFQSFINSVYIILSDFCQLSCFLRIIFFILKLLNQIPPSCIIQLHITCTQIVEMLDGIMVSFSQSIKEISPWIIVICIKITTVVTFNDEWWTWNSYFWSDSFRSHWFKIFKVAIERMVGIFGNFTVDTDVGCKCLSTMEFIWIFLLVSFKIS